MTLSDDQLREAAGDYVAGDLDEREDTAFRHLLDRQPDLRTDVAFWQGLRSSWRDSANDEGLGIGFAESVLVRAQRQDSRHRVIRLPLWAVATGTAIAAALVVALILPTSPTRDDGAMYGEDGFAVLATQTTGPWERALPRALVTSVVSEADCARQNTHCTRPYAGIWTRPVRIEHDGKAGGGHLILRVAGGSPADRCGLRPGDIIRSIDDYPVFTPACIAHQLEDNAPGTTVQVNVWRPATGEDRRVSMVLEALYE